MSPQQTGHLSCFNNSTPRRHVKDGRGRQSRNENGQISFSSPKSSISTPSSKGRNQCSPLNRPCSVELFPSNSRRYSYSEPTSLSTGSSPVNKSVPLVCSRVPSLGASKTADQFSLKLFMASQNLRKHKKYGPRQQNQSSESLKALADRFASSRYSDSPKAKQLPLPPVDWIDKESVESRLSEPLDTESSVERVSPILFGTFSSQFTEDFQNLERLRRLVLEDSKACRATPIHMNALQLIEAVSAS